MMKNNSSVVSALLLCITIAIGSSCGKENRTDCIKRTGKPATEIRVVPPFNKVNVTDNIDVFIIQGNTQEVKIEAGSHLIGLIKTEVDSGILHISNDNRCNWARSYKNGTIKVYVTMPALRYLWHLGSGLVKSEDTIHCDTLDIWAHETGNVDLILNANITFLNMHTTADITLHGKSISMGVWHSGEGFLHCEDFKTEFCWPHSTASGDEYLNVGINLWAKIDWEGNIFYTGTAIATIEGTGKGKLIQEN